MGSATRPLVLALLALVAGLVPGLWYAPEPLVPGLAAAVLVLLPLLAAGGRPGMGAVRAALWAAFACVGLALGSMASRETASDCRVRLADRAELRVRGVLAANSLGAAEEADLPPLLPLYAHLVAADGRAVPGCGGVLRVRLPAAGRGIEAGAVLEVHGAWTRFAPPAASRRWPSDPRFAGHLRADSVSVLQPPRLAAHPLLTLRGRTESHLLSLFPTQGAIAEALLLGRRERVDPALRDRFARAGMAHLLAISGMHVGLIAGLLLLAGQWVRRLLGLPRRAPVWLAIGGILAYLLVIGAPSSAVRAGIMFSLALLGLLLQRPFSPLPMVSAAALLIVAHRPITVLEPGFQLSFAGVLGILLFRAALFPRLPDAMTEDGWRRGLTEMLLASTAATVATAPIVVWHFGLVSPVGLLSNLAGIPVMGFGLVGLVASAALALFVAPAGQFLAAGTEAAFFLLDRIAALAVAVPYGHATVSRPAAWLWLVAAAALLLTLDAAARLATSARWLAAAGAALVVLGAGPAVAGVVGEGRGRLELHFLDVGQGDATAIRTPGGRWVLVDAGPADARFDAGERRVLPFLRQHGARRIEALILTHPHLDHIGGAPALLRALPTGALIEPGYVTGSPVYLEVLRAAEERGVPWRAARSGRVLEIDGVRFEFLWPDPETLDVVHDANEISSVVLVRFGGFAALLTGDAYAAQEAVLAHRHGATLRAQVLKAGHHGSRTSTSNPFLDAVQPDLVVISAGRRNRFGHPAPEVLGELRARSIPIARTDHSGTITVVAERGQPPRWSVWEP
jgi:competence protein ComEC